MKTTTAGLALALLVTLPAAGCASSASTRSPESLPTTVSTNLPTSLPGAADGGAAGGGAGASCIAPTVELSTAQSAPGAGVTVTGQDWFAGCNDTGPDAAAPQQPATDLPVVFVQGDREVELVRVDADARNGFTTDVTVPTDAQPGEAGISVGGLAPVPITVTG